MKLGGEAKRTKVSGGNLGFRRLAKAVFDLRGQGLLSSKDLLSKLLAALY